MPDVRGKRVLIVGDSLSSGQFSPGAVMAAKLEGAKAVSVNARIGRSANNFFGREDHERQLREMRAFDPDLVLVVLGTNDIGLSMSVDKARMIQLRDELAETGASVWAIGPPAFPTGTREHQGSPAVVSMMRSVFGQRFLDLRPITADLISRTHRTSDLVHFTAAGGKLAGERMAEKVIATPESGGGWLLAAALVVAGYIALR